MGGRGEARRPPAQHSTAATPATKQSCLSRNSILYVQVSLLQTINSLFIVSICREAATLISGLLHKAYSRLLSELKRQTQMPRSLLPTVSHLSGEAEKPSE